MKMIYILTNSPKPEFDNWRWDDYWSPIDEVIDFKRDVYDKSIKAIVSFLDIK